jgi:hypothetical protein
MVKGIVITVWILLMFGISDFIAYRAGQESVEKAMIAEGVQKNAKLQQSLSDMDSHMSGPYNKWQGEPAPVHRWNLDHAYWEHWCRTTFGTAKEGPHFRQNAMDWSDHCTEAGEANGR